MGTHKSWQWLVLLLLLAAGIAVVYAVNTLATPFRSGAAAATTTAPPSIYQAAEKGDVAAIKQELTRGVSVDSKLDAPEPGRQGMTPLMAAAMAGKVEAVKALLDAKAKADARTPDGRTPIFFAAAWGGPACVQALLDAGARVDARADGGWTPLMLAAARGDEATVKVLLAAGAEVNGNGGEKEPPNPPMVAALSRDPPHIEGPPAPGA